MDLPEVTQKQEYPLVLMNLFFAFAVIGVVIGSGITFLNRVISPTFMEGRLDAFSTGVIGLGIGLILGSIYIIFFRVATKNYADWNFARTELIRILLFIVVGTVIGGVVIMILAYLTENIFSQTQVVAVPYLTEDRMPSAWCLGSFLGIVPSVLIGFLVSTIRVWREREQFI